MSIMIMTVSMAMVMGIECEGLGELAVWFEGCWQF